MSSSDLYIADGSSHYLHSSCSAMASYEPDQFFSEPFSPFSDIDILQAISDHQIQQNPANHDHSLSFDQSSPVLISSSSPPSYQLESLSLYQTTLLNHLDQNGPNLANGLVNFSPFDDLEVKTEECHVALENGYSNNQAFGPHSYSGAENVENFMKRSYSSNSFDGKPSFHFQPRFDTLMESQAFQHQALSLNSPESSFLAGQMRRVSSTGDLQSFRTVRTPRESSVMEEAAANFKMGRYSAEERKERISKYRAKRSQRNFNKTIKYACRKTLADNRPRIRGRFARNDETGEILKAACSSNREEDEDGLWVEGFNVEEEENGTVRGGGEGAQFMNTFGPAQFQYYGF